MINISNTPITDYVNSLQRYSTQKTYLSSLRLFISYIYEYKAIHSTIRHIAPEDHADIELLAKQYLTEERNYKRDILQYLQQFPGVTKTMWLHLAIFQSFLVYYEREMPRRDMIDIRKKLPKKWEGTQNVELDIPMIRKVLEHSDEKTRAIVLLACSTGMRIREILSLEWENIEAVEGANCYRIYIKGNEFEKTGHSKITFCTEEAFKAVEAWLLVRDEYVAHKKGLKWLVPKSSNTIFPFSTSTFYKFFNNALKRAGLLVKDKKTHKHTLHIHLTRNFWRTSMLTAGMYEPVAEFFIHASSSNYNRYTKKQLVTQYLKCMHAVTIGVDSEVFNENRELKHINTELQTEVENVQKHNEVLTKEVQTAMELLLKLLNEKGVLGSIAAKTT